MLVLTGTPHAFTRYHYPIYDPHSEGFCRFDNGDFGNLLFQEAPEKVCTVLLHQPFPDRLNGYAQLVLPTRGAIDQVMAGFTNRRVGFDLAGTPLGNLPDDSYYATGYIDFRLGQLADGYIYEKPLSEFEGCTIDDKFLNTENWPEAQRQFPDPDWHPKPQSLAEFWEQIRAYTDIQKRYSSLMR